MPLREGNFEAHRNLSWRQFLTTKHLVTYSWTLNEVYFHLSIYAHLCSFVLLLKSVFASLYLGFRLAECLAVSVWIATCVLCLLILKLLPLFLFSVNHIPLFGQFKWVHSCFLNGHFLGAMHKFTYLHLGTFLSHYHRGILVSGS